MFLLVPAYPGRPGQKAIKQLCVCVCVCLCTFESLDNYNALCIYISISKMFCDVRSFERELRIYAGDDPLSVWVR